MSEILYVVGARSFSSINPGRKISEVINVWKESGIVVNTIFGRDLISKNVELAYGNPEHFKSSFRNKKLFQFFINSLSELKDIIHNSKLFLLLSQDYSTKELDLIWERSSRLHWAGLKLARKKNIPFVLEWKDHLIDYKFSIFKWFANYIENKKLKKANYIVVESQVLKDFLIQKGVNKEKIRIALNAVNPHEFVRDEKKGIEFINKYNISKDHIIVGYLGSYAFYHDTVLLVKAAHEVLKNNENVTFILVGNGKDYTKCKNLATELNLFDKNFIMLEGVPKEQVPFILSAIDISVLPGSTNIICPIKIMEYMAAETAVIAPDYLCNREILDETNGILFKPHNVTDLSEKIQIMVSSDDKRKILAKNARCYVKNKLTWEQTWGKVLLDILKDEKHNTTINNIV